MSNIVTFGAGGVGTIESIYLSRNSRLTLVDSHPRVQAHLKQIDSHGAQLIHDGYKPELEERIAQINVATSIDEVDITPDVVIIATKAFSLSSVMNSIKNRYSDSERSKMTFVCLQNGFGNEQYVSNALHTNALRVAVNYVGSVKSPGVVAGHWLRKPNCMGATHPEQRNNLAYVARLFNDSGLTTTAVPDIRPATFLKTVLNAAMSPVATAKKMTMGEVMADPRLSELVMATVEEGLRVGEAMGFKYAPGLTDLETLRGYLVTGEDHPTSMAQDLRRGHQTEADWYNLPIIEIGEGVKIRTPLNRQLYKIVKDMENDSQLFSQNIDQIEF